MPGNYILFILADEHKEHYYKILAYSPSRIYYYKINIRIEKKIKPLYRENPRLNISHKCFQCVKLNQSVPVKIIPDSETDGV